MRGKPPTKVKSAESQLTLNSCRIVFMSVDGVPVLLEDGGSTGRPLQEDVLPG